MKKKYYWLASAVLMAFPQVSHAQETTSEEQDANENIIVVTAQRQTQSLQDVPIAVSAFNAEALENQQIENASDLQLTLPNVSFSKGNFTSASFTIRGVGDLCVGVTCDAATAIHVNGSPLFGTRLFETEYFDLERIEVLRGPQGTLFGRNATSGVVNVVTAKPKLSNFEAETQFEYGNFNSIEARGMVNIPIGDTIGVRLAGIYVNRDGYTTNLFDGSDIDDRDLYALRGSLRFEPGPDTTIDLMGYYFRENDTRLRNQKQTCQRDPLGVLGCLNNRRDFDSTNANSTVGAALSSSEFFAIQGIPAVLGLGSLYGPDGFAGFQQPADPRVVNTAYTPLYFADELQVQARLEQKIGARAEHAGVKGIASLHVFHRQNGRTGGHAADQRQAELLDEADAPRRTGFEHDGAFLGERLEVLLGGVVRGEAERAGDFRPRRRRAKDFQRIPNEIENFPLARRQFFHHGLSGEDGLYFYTALARTQAPGCRTVAVRSSPFKGEVGRAMGLRVRSSTPSPPWPGSAGFTQPARSDGAERRSVKPRPHPLEGEGEKAAATVSSRWRNPRWCAPACAGRGGCSRFHW